MKTAINKALSQIVADLYPQAAETCDAIAEQAVIKLIEEHGAEDIADVLSMARSAAYMLRIEQTHTAVDLLYAMRDCLALSEAQKHSFFFLA